MYIEKIISAVLAGIISVSMLCACVKTMHKAEEIKDSMESIEEIIENNDSIVSIIEQIDGGT